MMRTLVIVFSAAAALCVTYLIMILGYGGIGTPDIWIWPLFAALFVIMAVFSAKRKKSADGGMPRFLPTAVFTSFALMAAGFAFTMLLVLTASTGSKTERSDYCIVIGARVYNDGISRTLKYRLDKAIEYQRDNPDMCMVLTGGQDRSDAVPEALAMYNYLAMNGVPAHRLMIYPFSNSTAPMISGALSKIKDDIVRRKTPKGPGDVEWNKAYEPVISLITSDYHIYRARRVAEKQGVKNLIGIAAESDRLLFVHQCVRESKDMIADFLMGHF